VSINGLGMKGSLGGKGVKNMNALI
jgi:hypothetical protein